MSGDKQDTVLYRNEPKGGLRSSGGRPATSSNAKLMLTQDDPEYFSGGFIVDKYQRMAKKAAQREIKKLADAIEARFIAQDVSLRAVCNLHAKFAGEEREPELDNHGSAPSDKMRPRAELILYTREGVYGIDKGDYLLFPGGAVDDGEQPRDAAIRETLEEANRHPVNVEGGAVVEAVWPEDSGNEFWDDSEFDGERTYFFCGLDRGDAGITHDDLEDFQVIPYKTVLAKLDELIGREDQDWAKRNNEVRMDLVKRAQRTVKTKDGRSPHKQAQAQQEVNQVGIPVQPPTTPPLQPNTAPITSPVTGIPIPEDQAFVQRIAENIQPTPPQQPPGQPPAAGQIPPGEGAVATPSPALASTTAPGAQAPKMAQFDDVEGDVDEEDPIQSIKDVQQDIQADVHGAPSATEQIAWAQQDPIRRANRGRKTVSKKDEEDEKPYLKKQAVIKQEDGKFVLYTKDGKRVLGRHGSKEKALAQERAVQASKHAEVIEGGFAAGKTVEDIAKKHGVDVAQLEAELKLGIEVELEHTENEEMAREIALDHLWEMADYYTRLKGMEEEAKEKEGSAPTEEQAKQIIEYVASTPDIDDDKLHKFFEELGVDPHEGERIVYETLQRQLQKKADLAQFLPTSQHVLFTPDGQMIVKRGINRRFVLPTEGPGRSAPYEDPVNFIPEGGIPDEGYHGYRIGTRVGEAEDVPEGFETMPPEAVLRDLYASMGLAVNKPFRQIDRARARTIIRYLKKKKRQREEAGGVPEAQLPESVAQYGAV